MSLYQKLIRKAWKSGDYALGRSDAASQGGESAEGERLRSQLRSKMEWVMEREGCDAMGGAKPFSREDSAMKLAQYVKFREEKFGGVLFETRSEKVFSLSPTGAAVVKEIVAGGGDGDVVERLMERYEDKTGEMEKEAKVFIADLKEKGLITE